jgi:hypothetical protein
MIPLGGFGLFVRGFNVGIVGYQIRVVLGVTKLFWEWFGFSGGTLGFGGLGFCSGFGRRGLRNFFSGSGVRLGSSSLCRRRLRGEQLRVMDFEPAQCGGVAGEVLWWRAWPG